MTNLFLVLGAAVGLAALAGLGAVGYAICKAAAKPVPRPVPAVTAKGRPLDHCAFCGRLVAVRKRDGMPYAGRHACRKAPETLTEAHAEGAAAVTGMRLL